MLAFFFGPEVVGFFALGKKVLGTPITIIGEAVSRVFYQKASDMKNKKRNVYVLLSTVIVGLFIISLIPMAILFLFGSKLFGIIFGSNWTKAGWYVQILIPMYLMKFIVTPISKINFIYNKQEVGFIWQIVYFFVSILSIIVGGMLKNVFLSLFLYSIGGMIMYFLFIDLAIRWSEGKLSHIFVYFSERMSGKIDS